MATQAAERKRCYSTNWFFQIWLLGGLMKDDPYIYSEENMKYLQRSIEQVESGKGTVHELKDCPSKSPSRSDIIRENDKTSQ